MDWSRENIAWAAGLFEGEGCWTWANTPRAALGMTDRDSVERFARIVGVGWVYQELRPMGEKTMWRWNVNGFEPVQALLAAFWPWLGTRRRGRAVEVLRRISSERERALGRERTRRYRQRRAVTMPAG